MRSVTRGAALAGLAVWLAWGSAAAEEPSWANARAGDRLTWRWHGKLADSTRTHEFDIDATLEVAAVGTQHVFVVLSLRDKAGERLAHPLAARDLLIPVGRDEETKPAPVAGGERVKLTAAERAWDCTHEVRDERAVDGPKRETWVASDPSLYLGRGSVRMTSSFAGMTGISGSMERTLVAVKRGREGDRGAVPADATWYIAPGAWYVDHAEPGGERIRYDFWCAAGVLARRESHSRKTLDGTLEPLCDPNVTHDRTLPELIDDLCATATDDMLPPEEPKPSEETLALPTGKLALDVLESGWTDGPTKKVTKRDFSARDPFASALAGLVFERRFAVMRHVTEIVEKDETRRETLELEDWGPR